MTDKLPLEDIRVLDFGQYIAGPMTAALLADQGADVIRIEPPNGPWWKSPATGIVNRRKRSIVLDLKEEEDVAIARRLIITADVLIENFRPGVMQRLGLGPDESRDINQSLIYVALPGFASSDQERSHLQAWEAVIAAESGQFSDMGLNRVLMGINPSFSPLTLASAYACLFASTAIGAALHARLETGEGSTIEVPLASALMEGLVYNSMHIEDYPERYKSPREKEVERRRAADVPLDMAYEDLQEFLDPFYRSYFCADGRPVYVVSASHVTHGHKTLAVLGLLEQARAAGIPELEDWYLPTHEWPEGVDCSLGLYPLSRKWARWLSTRMKARFLEKTSFEWERLFCDAGVPAIAHRTSQEWLSSEHALSSGLVHERRDTEKGVVRQAGPVAWLSSSSSLAASPARASAPDDSRKEIIAELEGLRVDKQPVRDRARRFVRGWLEGVKILDLTNVIAGPTIASTLARFGAEIIKLDPVRPTFDPWNTVIFGLQANRGKRSLLLDIKRGEGKDIYQRLIKWADLITINCLDRQLDELGLSQDQLKSINPDVVLCQLDAFGGPRKGPRSDHPGYDDLAQAMTGIMARFGGSLETPEEHAHLGTIDVLAGIAGAFVACVGLFRQRRDGVADVARSSLASAGQLLQIPFLYDFEGRGPFDEPSGHATKGYHALYRLYRCKDGHLFLATDEGRLSELSDILGITTLAVVSDQERVEHLQRTFDKQTMSYWFERLGTANIGIGRVSSLAELRARYQRDFDEGSFGRGGSYQFNRFDDHPSGRQVQLFAPCAIRPRKARVVSPSPSEKYGHSTRSILLELGLDATRIDELLAQGVASEAWSKDYLPD